MKLRKYNQNLKLVDIDGTTCVMSYSTIVAKVEGQNLRQLGYWSKTTQKHINYVAKELNLNLKHK